MKKAGVQRRPPKSFSRNYWLKLNAIPKED